MNKILTQPEKIEYILSHGCDYFGISRESLTEKVSPATHIYKIKRLFIPLLKEFTIISDIEITKILGYNKLGFYHVKKAVNELLSDEFYGDANLRGAYQELRDYLKIKNGVIDFSE